MKRLETTSHHNKELLVYRVQHDSGKVMDSWYYAINIPHQKTIKDKSTRLSDFASALMFAESQYQKLKQRDLLGLSIASVSLEQVYKDAREYYERRHQAGLLDKTRFHRFQISVERLFIPYFSHELERDFSEINTLDVENWIVWRKAKGQRQRGWHNKSDLPEWLPQRKVSDGTINVELQMLRMVYDYAEKSELILPAQRPTIKALKHNVKDNRRPHFTRSEWGKITTYLANKYVDDMPPHMAKTSLASMYRFFRLQNRYYWNLLYLSSCRVGELRNVKWGHIDQPRKIKNQKSDAVYRTLITVDGKTGRRRVVCQPYATKMFEDWKKICAEFGVSTNSTDLVFRHPSFSNHGAEKIDQPIETTNVAFKGVLDKLNLGTDADGRQRTVYSIRHSIISHLLADGVNLNAISKNAGVSIETMTRAYDHTESVDYINEITKADKTKFDEFYEPMS